MKENLYTEKCIRTFTGIYINVFNPTPEMICIEDIAHSLSMQCRFGGHLPKFYSVAQHSILCTTLVSDEYKLQALMHDASEAYLLDIPRPIKKHLSNYKEIENKLTKAIAMKFRFDWPLSDEVKRADETMLNKEWFELMLGEHHDTICWSQPIAEDNFLKKFDLLFPSEDRFIPADNPSIQK